MQAEGTNFLQESTESCGSNCSSETLDERGVLLQRGIEGLVYQENI